MLEFRSENVNQNLQILFDYQTKPLIYLSRCKKVLEKMLDCGLINKMLNCHSIDDFHDNKFFTEYDLIDIDFSRSMLEKIAKNPYDISINSNDELMQIIKIIMKKYLMKTNCSYSNKVNIQVIVPGSKKIQIVSYANKNKFNYYKLKDPGGTIDDGEDPLNAAIRELTEELGLIIHKSRFILIDSRHSKYLYQVTLTIEEYMDYIKNIDNLDIDPEITLICLVNV